MTERRPRIPKVPRLSHLKRPVRIVIGVTLTAFATAYILLKIDVHQTWETLKSANVGWFALAVTIGGAVLLSRPSPPLRDASHDSPRLGASGRDDESSREASAELAGRPRPVPGDEHPSDAVPLV